MRYTNFAGLSPKRKPQTADPALAQVAHNLDLYSGELRPFNAPVGVGLVRSVDGEVLDAPAQTLYNAGGVWVGFPEHTWVIPDTVGALQTDRFLFVRDQQLWWQNAAGVINARAPIKVGVEPPCDAPNAVVLADVGCRTAAPGLECITPQTGVCPDHPAQAVNYVYTWVRRYGNCVGREEESGPSPSTVVDVFTGDAVALSSAALPDGVDAVRWYREISDGKDSVYLFAGESDSATFVDDLCPEELGEPLILSLHYPPPSCIEGVAQIGDTCVLVWNGKHIWVSEPNRPHAYDADRNQYDIPYRIVAVRGNVARVEGANTYDAHILTEGKPYRLAGRVPESLEVTETQHWHPCVSVHSVCDMRGQTGYCSPYGFVTFSGTDVVNLTDNYMTEREWQQHMPAEMRAVWWNERVWMGRPFNDGFVLTVEEQGGMRPKTLVTHGVRVQAWHAAADTRLHLCVTGSGDLQEWGRGAPMWFIWHGEEEVQSGLWKPAAVKVVSTHMRRRYNDEEVYAAYEAWSRAQGKPDPDGFVQEYPEHKHLYNQLAEYPCLRVGIYRDGHLIYHRVHRDSRPLRIPRTVRALEWSVRVEGYSHIREIHMQSSISDMSQEGGMA